MTDETSTPDARVFDMPHARVTLTPVGPGIEIEVWPKRGQSAYAVVDPTIAVLIARQLVELAAAQLAAAQLVAAREAAEAEDGGAEDGEDAADVDEPEAAPEEPASPPGSATVIDLASRRRRDPGAAG